MPSSSAGGANASATEEPRFEVRRFVVEGATLLAPAEIQAATAPFTGPNRDFGDVQRALEALERAYADKGYSAVQVVLPEQELSRGEVRFKVIEAHIGRLIVQGNRFFDDANIRASLPALAPGRAPNIHEIAQDLKVANENPSKQTTVLLRGGTEEGQVDAVVRVTDEKPLKYSFTMDNTGTEQTGIFRVGFGLQHANLWNRDHVLSMQYVTAPNDAIHTNRLSLEPSSRVFIFGGSYHIPLYSLGDSVDVSLGYSNVNSGTVQFVGGTSFNVSGSGTIAAVRYNKNLPRVGELEHRVAFGLDWRAYQSFVAQVGSTTTLVPDYTVHPYSVTYSGVYRRPASETSFNFGWLQNLPGGNDGGSTTFALPGLRPGARPGYLIWRYGVNHNQAFSNDWQARFAFSGQFTRDKLVPAEQFGIGGMDSVRGFLEREITNDVGYRGTLELYTPDWGGRLPWLPGARARGVVFTDWGAVRRNEPLAGESYGAHIQSVGFGVRVARGANLSLRLDYALVTDPGGLVAGGWHGRVHAAFAYVF